MHAKRSFLLSIGMVMLLAAWSGAGASDNRVSDNWASASLDSSISDSGAVLVSGGYSPTAGGLVANFGTREVGTLVRSTLAYTSTGAAVISNIEVGPITGSGANAFEIFNEECTGAILEPGEQCLITVDFSPPAAELFEAQFQLTSTAADSPETVFLVGRGVIDLIFNDSFEEAIQ